VKSKRFVILSMIRILECNLRVSSNIRMMIVTKVVQSNPSIRLDLKMVRILQGIIAGVQEILVQRRLTWKIRTHTIIANLAKIRNNH